MTRSLPVFAPLESFRPTDDLLRRQLRNFDRLEEEKYDAVNVFQRARAHEKWPGDIEGRTLLAWVLLARATGRAPRHLDAMLAAWPAELNALGYFGKSYTDGISEQQLSSHGWVLRGLAELERWRPGGPARELARPVLENLFLPIADAFDAYPLDPADREAAGSYCGTHLKQIGRWILSSDVGCFAIGMDGVIDAYSVFQDERLVPLIETMVARFLQIDLDRIRAQTHATLTGCRALLRWADLAGRPELVEAAAERHRLYTGTAWTETHANYNWFNRPEWTEPCAVVDSLQLTMELWRRLGDPRRLTEAQLIWFNALGHGQRVNGGFGCDTCPGADGSPLLVFSTFESHWCCTMRGGEGLACMNHYQVVRDGDTLVLPFLLPGDYHEPATGLRLAIASLYPHAAEARITLSGDTSSVRRLRVFVPEWIKDAALTPAGTPGDGPFLEAEVRGPGFFEFRGLLPLRARALLPATRLRLERVPATAARLGDAALQVWTRGPLVLSGAVGDTDASCTCAQDAARLMPIFQAYLEGVTDKAKSARRLLFPVARTNVAD